MTSVSLGRGAILGWRLSAAACLCSLISPLQVVPQVTFRSDVNLVELDVVVTDGRGNKVLDLTAEDFEVSESGRLQRIVGFEAISFPPGRADHTLPILTGRGEGDDTSLDRTRLWVLVIDDLHIVETHIVHTQRVVREFFEAISPTDLVSTVFVGRDDLGHGFTVDLQLQQRTVDQIRAAVGFAPDALNPVNEGEATQRYRFALDTATALSSIVKKLAAFSGIRKAIVYVGEGLTVSQTKAFYRDHSDFSKDVSFARDLLLTFQRFMGLASSAGIPVYALDPRGTPTCSAIRGDCHKWNEALRNINDQQQFLRTLSENTGGLAFVNHSDPVGAMRQLVSDSRVIYLLRYYPEPFEADRKFNKVSVRVKRPGLHARARAGYSTARR